MIRIVHKFPLSTESEQTVLLPVGAKIISAGWQHWPKPTFVLWALVVRVGAGAVGEQEQRMIAIRPTGSDIVGLEEDLAHISTIQIDGEGNGTVWHIFERT